MADIIKMPKLSDTMTEGVVAKWHKKVGDEVKSGDLLAEIETDKATMEFESYQDGFLLHIGIGEGKSAPVDGLLAIIGKKGESIDDLLKKEKSASNKLETPASENTSVSAPIEPIKTEKVEAKSLPIETPVTDKSQTLNLDNTIKISPIAKKMAKDNAININLIKGSGDGGRIIKSDLDKWLQKNTSGSKEKSVAMPLSQMRKTIAKRLSQSKFTAPHFYLKMSVNMDQLMTSRSALMDHLNIKFSINDFIVLASAKALEKHPKINASWSEEAIIYHQHIHIGIAVAVEDGLIVPVIKFANEKTLSHISEYTKTLAFKARDKKLQPDEFTGNTFTISNLGMYGIDEFTAIINPPDACILAVGAAKEVLIKSEGEIITQKVMKLTLSCDHRVVDGASGAQFLQTLKTHLENPVLFLAAGNL